MGKLVEHLMRCAVCGAVPVISYIYEIDPSEGHDYKLFCSKCGVHNSTGEWYENKYKACLAWNRRQQENETGKRKKLSDQVTDSIATEAIKSLFIAAETIEKLRKEKAERECVIKRLQQWRINLAIKSPLANISGLCCVHCDHKDEYIIELQEENEKLKRLLKMAADEPEKSDAKSGG